MSDVQFETVDAWLQDWTRRRDGGHHLQAIISRLQMTLK